MKAFSLRAYLKKNPHARYALLLPAFLLLFLAAEKLVPPGGDYWVSYHPLDDRIPFVESFVLAYVLWYPLLFGVGLYLLLYDGPQFKKYMLFLMIGFCTALIFCLLVPNEQNLRPAGFERENLCTALLTLLYRVDTNTNVFPSMHVIGSIGAAVAACKSDLLRRYRVPIFAVAIAICLSTVLVKQHSVLDILGGIVWCIPLYGGIYGFRRKPR